MILVRALPLAYGGPPGRIQISEVLLTEWATSCVHIDHLGTLIQNELRPSASTPV